MNGEGERRSGKTTSPHIDLERLLDVDRMLDEQRQIGVAVQGDGEGQPFVMLDLVDGGLRVAFELSLEEATKLGDELLAASCPDHDEDGGEE